MPLHTRCTVCIRKHPRYMYVQIHTEEQDDVTVLPPSTYQEWRNCSLRRPEKHLRVSNLTAFVKQDTDFSPTCTVSVTLKCCCAYAPRSHQHIPEVCSPNTALPKPQRDVCVLRHHTKDVCAVWLCFMMLLAGNASSAMRMMQQIKAAIWAHQHRYDILWGRTVVIRAWGSPPRTAHFWAPSSSPCYFQICIILWQCLGNAGKEEDPTAPSTVQSWN